MRVPTFVLLPVVVLLGTACDRSPTVSNAEARRDQSQANATEAKAQTSAKGKQRMERHRRAMQAGGVKYQRGRFLQQPLAADGLPPLRRFGPLDDAARADLQKWIALARSHPGKEETLKLIEQARELNSIEVLPLVEVLLKNPDPDVRGNALSLMEGTKDPQVLGVVNLALNDVSADVRIQAMEIIGRVASPEAAPVLRKAFADQDNSVRQLAFQTALKQDDTMRHVFIGEAIKSPYEDLAQAGVGIIEAEPSKNTVTMMMDALSSSSSFVREKAHDALFLTFHEDFANAAVAKGWWLQNHSRFDENLVLKNP